MWGVIMCNNVTTAVQLGEGIKFERIRRITGYLSDVSMFNNAKRSEEHDRVQHITATNIDRASVR